MPPVVVVVMGVIVIDPMVNLATLIASVLMVIVRSVVTIRLSVT